MVIGGNLLAKQILNETKSEVLILKGHWSGS